MKLSIIVPAYNTEAYLGRCLDSCLDQDMPGEDYEIIVVNDGSTDGTLLLAENYAADHPSMKVYSQDNGGLSRARNAGLALATGEYVWFVDSDDTIASKCLASLYSLCSGRDLDILAISSERIVDGKAYPHFVFDQSLDGIVHSGPEVMRKNLIVSPCAPFMLFRRQFLADRSLLFYPGVFHEDEEFSPRALYQAGRVSFCGRICYSAFVRGGSIMQTVNPRRVNDILLISGRLQEYAETVPTKDRWVFSRRITNLLNSSLKLSRRFPEEERQKFGKELAERTDLLRHYLRCREPKFHLTGVLFLLFPQRILSIYDALQHSAKKAGLSTEKEYR